MAHRFDANWKNYHLDLRKILLLLHYNVLSTISLTHGVPEKK